MSSPMTPQAMLEKVRELRELATSDEQTKYLDKYINAFPSIAQAYEQMYKDCCVMRERLKEISEMRCIQHMPSCSDKADIALSQVSCYQKTTEHCPCGKEVRNDYGTCSQECS